MMRPMTVEIMLIQGRMATLGIIGMEAKRETVIGIIVP